MDVAKLSAVDPRKPTKTDSCTYEIIDEKYPSIAKLIGESLTEGTGDFSVDSKYLKMIGQIGDIFGASTYVTIHSQGNNDPITFTVAGDLMQKQVVDGMLMPCREIRTVDLKQYCKHWPQEKEEEQ